MMKRMVCWKSVACALIGGLMVCASPARVLAADAAEEVSADDRIARLEKLVTALQSENEKMSNELSTIKQTQNTQVAQVAQSASTESDMPGISSLQQRMSNMHFAARATSVVQGVVGGNSHNTYRNDPDKDWKTEYSDSADATISLDLEIQAPVGNRGLVYSLVEAGRGAGLDGDMDITTWSGTNGDIMQDDDLHLTELWYQHMFFNDRLTLRAGLLDPTNTFDTNAYANDETTQFLSPGFINTHNMYWGYDSGTWMNGITGAREQSIYGAELVWNPINLLSLSLGGYDGDGDMEDVARDAFGIVELGIHPSFRGHKGNYRFNAWANNEVESTRWYDTEDDKTGWGVGLSFDQEICKYFGIWGRYGYSDEDIYALQHTWSAGITVFGKLWHRDNDTFAMAVGKSYMSDEYERKVLGANFNDDDEMHFEAYYRYQVNDYLALTPDIQMIWNPMSNDDLDHIMVVAARAQVDF